jgi:hypothetical protein
VSVVLSVSAHSASKEPLALTTWALPVTVNREGVTGTHFSFLGPESLYCTPTVRLGLVRSTLTLPRYRPLRLNWQSP